MKHNHTLIIGGGIVGATLALKLAQQNLPVTLVDARPSLSHDDWARKLGKRDARVYALSLASINLLTEVGAWQSISRSQRKADYVQMQVWQRDGMGELLFGEHSAATDHDADNEPAPILGSMVEPAVIEHALWQRLQSEEVSDYLTVISGQKVVQMDWLGAERGYRI